MEHKKTNNGLCYVRYDEKYTSARKQDGSPFDQWDYEAILLLDASRRAIFFNIIL